MVLVYKERVKRVLKSQLNINKYMSENKTNYIVICLHKNGMQTQHMGANAIANAHKEKAALMDTDNPITLITISK